MELVWSGVSGCDLPPACFTQTRTGSLALIKNQQGYDPVEPVGMSCPSKAIEEEVTSHGRL